jgi:DNA-binding MarR family transcriptional regulator
MPASPTPPSSREVSPDRTSRKRFGDDPRWIIQCLLWALKPLSNLRGSIPLPYVTTFLMVALDEGKGVGAYARDLGIHRWTMSRYLRDIGARARNGGPGLGLVAVEHDPRNPRQTKVLLTAKGSAIAAEVFRQLRRMPIRPL